MALDAKAIKEEIPDKDTYETSSRKVKGKEQCRTPDSPEGARVVAPRSPISPQVSQHHSTLVPQPPRSGGAGSTQVSSRNGSSSPPGEIPPTRVLNGNGGAGSGGGGGSMGSITPPPAITPASAAAAAAVAAAQQDTTKLLKIRRFLGALVQFGQDTNVDIGDRVRSLVLSLASGGLTVEEFQIAVQEATNFPLRSNVVPFLKSHVPVLQREINILSRASKQTPSQYVRSNETSVMEYVQNLADTADIFLSHEGFGSSTPIPAPSINGLSLKRRASDNLYDTHPSGPPEWGDYILPPTKRPHPSLLLASGTPQLYSTHPALFEYQNGTLHPHSDGLHSIHRDERDHRAPSSEAHRPPRIPPGGGSGGGGAGGSSGAVSGSGASGTAGAGVSTGSMGSIGSSGVPSNSVGSGTTGGEEEWKNIHTMLTCISAMVEKTKRAISILQQRGIETHARDHQDTSIADMKRQTEDKIAEFRRSAEESVNQVKRQAVIEIQRAVAAAEARTIEMFAQERLKMEKMFAEIHRGGSDPDPDGSSGGSQNVSTLACWNCGRKANETCSGCNLARYCGSFCQHKDWDQHHQVCGTSRAENAFQKHAASARAALSSRSTTPQQSQSSNSTANGTTAAAK
ncbi:protein CBFA2T2 isoform X1 [Malaya genurostris]|uniref:protein CBFA2T2 isoform X1 n=1 Tax=Malaya genurostris TaxID=325434 RepID=UPI0026F3E95E|nr:protein CBFA2T2 isoform X1 [Malaya genurostris]XP_058466937.1 protein CBFA2T2 isoform X1 [Malaya genurostris]XP_058466938.1 protein CBFA2T2 isoform X1 [Malaya genurostris]